MVLNMKSIIINADDFGLSDGVCRSILELFEANAISSTSLMVAVPNAIDTISRWNGKQLLGKAGVHLQLTGGFPLSSREKIPTVYTSNASNKFRDPRKGDLPKPIEVEIEWRTQVKTACELLGGLPSHIDSHHGMHRFPEFFQVYVKLAQEFNIPMRGAVSGPFKEMIEKESLTATTAIVREWTGRNLNSEELKKQLKKVENDSPNQDVIEVISHPGYSDKYLESQSSFSKVRENDHSVLLDLAKNKWWDQNGYKLISYKDFGDGIY